MVLREFLNSVFDTLYVHVVQDPSPPFISGSRQIHIVQVAQRILTTFPPLFAFPSSNRTYFTGFLLHTFSFFFSSFPIVSFFSPPSNQFSVHSVFSNFSFPYWVCSCCMHATLKIKTPFEIWNNFKSKSLLTLLIKNNFLM